MKKIALQTFKGSGHAGRGVGVYGKQLVEELGKIKDLEIVEFSGVSELENKNVDLVHFLVFDLFQKTLPSTLNVPSVITIHDVTPLVFAKQYPAGIKGRFNLYRQKKALKKIDRVITVSKNSKKDIEKYLGIKKKKIKVVYSGVGSYFKKINNKKVLNEVSIKYKLPSEFAFYSGNVNWNKNIVGMTQACIDANLDLVIVGKSFEQKDNLNHAEMKSYREFLDKFENNPKVHILGYVSDEDMVLILNQASVALFVSFYEGFGFPILEAQKCLVPVIAAKTSSMPEVGGTGALYVDPYDIDEIKNKILLIMNDAKLRNDLIDEGVQNAKKFSWEECAKETAKVYSELL